MSDEVIGDERPLFVDVILIYALFIIVFSHIIASYRQNLDEYGLAAWWMANVLDAWTRPGVPLFFMISGFLLLDTSRSLPPSAACRKTIEKIVIPLLAWSVLYALWSAHWGGAAFSWTRTLRQLLQEPVAYHLWFIYYLVGLSLAAPILKNYLKNIKTSAEKYYFIALWVFSVCVPLMLRRSFSINFGEWLVVATGYAGYFVMGRFLNDARLNDKVKWAAFFSMILLYAFGAGATYHLTLKNMGKLDEFFSGDYAPNIIAVSALTFYFLKALACEEFFRRSGRLRRFVRRLSAWSLGIYYVHLMVYEALEKGCFGVRFNEHTFLPAVGILSTTCAVIAIGGALTALLQAIPIVRMIVPADWLSSREGDRLLDQRKALIDSPGAISSDFGDINSRFVDSP